MTPAEQQAASAADDQRHVLLSYYGRVNYSYDGKYLLSASVRRDGSSRFGKDHRWGAFPSVALGWRGSSGSHMPLVSRRQLNWPSCPRNMLS